MKTSSVLNVYGVLDGEGVEIESKSMMYATTQSYVNPATLAESAWSREYPSSIAEGTWLHTRTILIYTDGNSTTTYMSAYMGKNGKDAFVIDLTNDADLFTTDSSGKTTFEQTRDTQVRLFLGAAKQTDKRQRESVEHVGCRGGDGQHVRSGEDKDKEQCNGHGHHRRNHHGNLLLWHPVNRLHAEPRQEWQQR